MIQADTRQVLLPILPGALHPGIQRLRALIQKAEPGPGWLIQWDRCLQGPETNQSKEEPLLPYFPGWEILQALGGPIAEVSAFAENSERMENDPLLLAGRFEKGGLFQATLMPLCPRSRLRLMTTQLQAELDFPTGFLGPTTLTWTDQSDTCGKEEWPAQDLFHEMVTVFEDAVRRCEQTAGPTLADKQGLGDEGRRGQGTQELVTWQDAIRCAELDDAARRSVERRRASTLEYPEATEEATFKGTMTLIGCGMLWLMVVLLVLARWYPALLMVIVLMLTLFLALQLLRLIVKK
jgi:hypothetical protein